MARSRLAATLLSAACIALPASVGPAARAADKTPIYPSTDQLRQVQLEALACGRENTASSCARARQMADPLMDHPLLSGFCKDAVWEILQTALPAEANTLTRRDRIETAADRMISSCRRLPKPKARTEGTTEGTTDGAPTGTPPAARPSGFGFGSSPR